MTSINGRCPKCGSINISGPRYQRRDKGDVLRYRCLRCGYSVTTPTADREQKP